MPGVASLAGTDPMTASRLSAVSWLAPLRCPICTDLFRKPRVLPCGHTFCSDCLNDLRDGIIKTGRKSPPSTPLFNGSFPDPNGAYGAGLTLDCPDPSCQYSMKLMNLSRWALRNRTVQDLVSSVRRHSREMKDASTQTDIGMESALLAIPRSIIPSLSRARPGAARDLTDSGDNSSEANQSATVGRILQRAFSTNSLSQSSFPSGLVTWKSCAAVIGISVIEQFIRI